MKFIKRELWQYSERCQLNLRTNWYIYLCDNLLFVALA